MAASQFTYYSASDAGAPQLSGAAGTLLAVLDACLVNGYGAKAAAGWTKPIANSGNCGHYKQGAGSGWHLFVNDNGPNITSTFQEAWVTGWKTMSALTAPVGVGTVQIPLPAQQLTTGHLVIKKTIATSAATIPWMLFADNKTFYFFSRSHSTSMGWFHFWFGDFYSLSGTADENRCLMAGRFVEAQEYFGFNGDIIDGMFYNGGTTLMNGTSNLGLYTAGYAGGVSASTGFRQTSFWAYGSSVSNTHYPYLGLIQCPNGPDNALYLSPVRIHDCDISNYRGRVRGMWACGHPVSSFTDGQLITGANDLAGKTFRAIRGVQGSVMFIETSNTVETN